MTAFSLALMVSLAADQSSAVEQVKPMAISGVLVAAAAAGMTAALPFVDRDHSGRSDPALALAGSAFFLVAVIRPFVFFTGAGAKPAKSAFADTLRVIGSLTAVGGLASFIAYGIMRGSGSSSAGWALLPTAGLEAISALAFSLDALTADVTPTVTAMPSRDGVVFVAGGLVGRF